MTGWLRIDADLLNDPAVQRLPGPEFRRAFYAALDGETNVLARYLRRCTGRPSAETWAQIRAEVFRRDDYTCRYCGERGKRLECDHVVPVSRGGSNDPSNLVTACFRCNRSKRAKTLAEWRR